MRPRAPPAPRPRPRRRGRQRDGTNAAPPRRAGDRPARRKAAAKAHDAGRVRSGRAVARGRAVPASPPGGGAPAASVDGLGRELEHADRPPARRRRASCSPSGARAGAHAGRAGKSNANPVAARSTVASAGQGPPPCAQDKRLAAPSCRLRPSCTRGLDSPAGPPPARHSGSARRRPPRRDALRTAVPRGR